MRKHEKSERSTPSPPIPGVQNPVTVMSASGSPVAHALR